MNKAEKGEISLHEVKLYLVLVSASTWLTNKEIAFLAGIADRTARMHTLRLVKLGILDLAEVFPAHKFRLSQMANKRNRGYLQRLDNACEVFGLTKTGVEVLTSL